MFQFYIVHLPTVQLFVVDNLTLLPVRSVTINTLSHADDYTAILRA